MFFKVYGAISQIYEPGVFTKCTPIFVNLNEKGKHTKFYRLDANNQITEIDLNPYGTPIFLPASKKKINDGKEYFIIYRGSQNTTQFRYVTYVPNNVNICTDGTAYWMSSSLSMGIKFPDQFVCVMAPDIDKDGLQNMMM